MGVRRFTPGREEEETQLSWDLDHFFAPQLERFGAQAKRHGVDFAAGAWRLAPLQGGKMQGKGPCLTHCGCRHGTDYLAGRMMRNVIVASTTGFVCAVVVAVSMLVPLYEGNTLVETAALSWLPVFSVIGLSMSASLGVFHFVRYKAALRLKGNVAGEKMDFFNRCVPRLLTAPPSHLTPPPTSALAAAGSATSAARWPPTLSMRA